MSKVCQVKNKKPVSGYSYTTRGIAKKNKGIGLNITGKSKRRFVPNVHKKRFWLPEEKRFITLTVSADGIRDINKKGISTVIKELRAKGMKI